jgi:hypothetical protein
MIRKLVGGLSPHLRTIKLVGLAVAAIALVAGTAWVTAEVKQGEIERMKAGYAKAEAEAVRQALERQKIQAGIDLKAAVEEAQKQIEIVTVTHTITKEIPIHVPLASKCAVTVGFLRVLDAAVHGVTPAGLPLAAGQSDDSCAATDPRTLALNIVQNYRTCEANAQQLTSLQAWVTDTIKASKAASSHGRK